MLGREGVSVGRRMERDGGGRAEEDGRGWMEGGARCSGVMLNDKSRSSSLVKGKALVLESNAVVVNGTSPSPPS